MAGASGGTRSDRLRPFLPGLVWQVLDAGAGADPVWTGLAAVASLDIIGFSTLADQLTGLDADGPEELRRRLNEVLAPAVATLTARGGDVMGFAGDSILAVFPNGSRDLARTAAQAAVDSGRRAGLQLRAGVSAGPATVALVGDGHRAHAVCLGSAIAGAIAAQHGADAGTVKVDWTAHVDAPTRPGTHRPVPAAAAFLPPGRTEQIRSGRALLLAERRPVVSVFVRLPGALAEPSRLDGLQRELVRALSIVRGFGGDVRQVETGTGSPVLVVSFGVTRAGTDDENQAVACARDLVATGDGYRAGVAGGIVFCGVLGTSNRRDLVVAGGSVNLAARLAGAANDGETLVDDRIFAATAGLHDEATPARELTLRGFSCPITARSITARPAASLATTVPPGRLVGRTAELRALLGIADQIARGDAETENVVLLRGPAGMGKSALAAAVVTSRDDHVGLRVRFTARETGWSAWTSAVQTMLDMPAGAQSQEAVAAALMRLGLAAEKKRVDLLRPILPFADMWTPKAGAAAGFDGRVRDELLAALVARILTGFSRGRRAVLVIEDAQLATSELLAVLRELVTGVPALVLVLVLVRDEPGAAAAPLPGQRFALGPLPVDAARALAHTRQPVLDELQLDRVVEFAGGNPLHVEQLALDGADGDSDRTLNRDARDKTDDVLGVAPILARVIRARLDRLSPLTRDVATVASVLADDVRADLVSAAYPVLGDHATVTAQLEHLVSLAILSRTAPGRYRFRHDMIRTVAYAGLGRRSRQDLHGALARYLARSGRRETMALTDVELVAWHFLQSRDVQGRQVWLRRAGDAARDAWSLTTAQRWYEALGGDGTDATARLDLADVQYLTGAWTAAHAGYAAVLAEVATNTAEHAAAAHGLGVLSIRTSSIPRAIDLLTDAADIWTALGRRDRLFTTLDRLTFAFHIADAAGPALTSARRLLRVAEELGDPFVRADALETAALAAWTARDLTTAGAHLTAALNLARSAGNLRCLVHGLSDLAGLRLDQGNDQAALTHLAEAEAMAARIGYRRAIVSLRANRGEVLRRRGDLTAAREQLVSALAGVLDLGDTLVATSVTGNLGLVEAARGHITLARRILTLAERAAELNGQGSARREFADALANLTALPPDRPAPSGDAQIERILARLGDLLGIS